MKAPWRRRIIGVIVVAITATLAWAANDSEQITVAPRLLGIRHQVGSNVTGTVMIENTQTQPFTGKIVAASCGGVRVAGGTGDPLSIPASSTLPVQIECPGTLTPGMHRCTFDIQNGSNQSVANFDGFCVTFTQQVLTALPVPVTFANQQVGVTSAPAVVTVTNPTANTVDLMSIQVDDPNFLVGSPCQDQLGCDAGSLIAGSSAPVEVLCKPLATGIHTGKLFLVGNNGLALANPIDLSCSTGSGGNAPILTISPPNVALQPVEVTGATSNATVELRNGAMAGAGNLTITSISIVDTSIPGAANDWQASFDGACLDDANCVLAPGDLLNVRLTFDPSSFNSRQAQLIINYSDPMGSKQATVILDGAGVGATLELVDTGNLEFGVIPLATAAMPQTFRLRNQGNRQTTANLAAAPMAPFLFPATLSIDPGETTVSVGCMSSSEVDASTSLSIDGPDTMATLALQMHCEVRDTQLTTVPTSLALGEVRIGSTPADRMVTIDRVGGGMPAIPLASAALQTAPDPNLTLGGLSGSNTPATTTLSITPAVEGAIANQIVVTPMTGQTIDVPVTGKVVTATLSADNVMTLGTFCVGQPTRSTQVNLSSTGTATVTVASVGLAGGSDSPFDLETVSPASYPSSLTPGTGKATVLVTPKRATAADPEVTDTLVWSTDAGMVSSVLTTRFVADGGAVAPDNLDFGDVQIRIVNDDALGVTLQNCSTDPLQLIEPVVPAPFALTGEFPLLLEPAARATFSILFLPTEVGPVEKQVIIESMGGDMFAVTLRGNGVTGDGSGTGGDDDGKLDETSFYACGCRSNGEPSGVLVIAFAAMWGMRRRRSAR